MPDANEATRPIAGSPSQPASPPPPPPTAPVGRFGWIFPLLRIGFVIGAGVLAW